MNFVNLIVRKPFSTGAILFFWLPVLGGCGVLLFYGIHYWYVALGAFWVICVIAGTQRDKETRAERIESELITRQMGRNSELINLINIIRMMPDDNGRPTPEKRAAWKKYMALEEKHENESAKERTQIVEAHGGYIE